MQLTRSILVVIALLCSLQVHAMHPTYVQHENNTGSDDYTILLPNVTTGNLVVVAIGQASSASRSYTVSDDAGNTYNTDAKAISASRISQILSAKNVTGGNLTLTININTGGVTFKTLAAEITGADKENPFDTNGSNDNSTTSVNEHKCAEFGMNTTSNVFIMCMGVLTSGGTSLTPGTYYTRIGEELLQYMWQYRVSNESLIQEYGYWNSSTARYGPMTIVSYKAPSNSAPTASSRIEPASYALDSQDLLGFCNGSDPDGNNLNYTYAWIKDGQVNLTGTLNNSYASGFDVNLANISSSNTTIGQTWTFNCSASDGTAESATSSSQTTVQAQVTSPLGISSEVEIFLFGSSSITFFT